ncbi:MAG: cytochrome c [Planctomycetia bacterium]|nr:cytochrome c [Planctomycetia bacterium]
MALRLVVAYAFVVLFCAVAGCNKSGESVASGPEGLYSQHCAKCHAQPGEPGGPDRGGAKGPDISKIGGKAGYNAGWIADYIRDPKSKRQNAKMPAFGDTLTEDQILSLAEYLAAKK